MSSFDGVKLVSNCGERMKKGHKNPFTFFTFNLASCVKGGQDMEMYTHTNTADRYSLGILMLFSCVDTIQLIIIHF